MQRNVQVRGKHLFAVTDRKVFGREHVVARTLDILQLEIPAALLGPNGLDALEAFEHIASRFCLLRLLAFEVSANELLGLRDHRLLVLVLSTLLLASKLTLDKELRIVALVGDRAAVLKLDDAVRRAI